MCILIKGLGHASILDLFLGCPETEAFRQTFAVMRVTFWSVEKNYEIF